MGYRSSGQRVKTMPDEDLTISSSRIFFRFTSRRSDAYIYSDCYYTIVQWRVPYLTQTLMTPSFPFYRPWAIDACGKAQNVENKGSFAISYHDDVVHRSGRSPAGNVHY